MKTTRKLLCLFACVIFSTRINAATQSINDITWTYSIENGYAVISTGVAFSRAVSPTPSGHLEIPETLGGYPVTIGESAFYGCDDITSVSIPDCVTYVGGSAFRGCSNLGAVTIPDNATGIFGAAFQDCTSLKRITIPSAVERIGPGAFKNCSKLVDVTIEYGVREIVHSAFMDCSSLTNIVIPSSVMTISNKVFSGCSKLASITLPFVGYARGNTETKDALFGYIFGESQYQGGNEVCQYYNALQATTNYIPSSLREVHITDETVIGYGAFRDCNMLSYIALQDTVRRMENDSFRGCSRMNYVRLPTSADSLGGSQFEACSNLTSVIIPAGITRLRGAQFKDCVNLECVTLPEDLTLIGNNSFDGCIRLKHITIPENVERMDSSCFNNCSNIESVEFLGSAPTLISSIGITSYFVNVPSNFHAYVHKGSSGWGVTIPGRWKELMIDYPQYNVSFNANGGEGTMAVQTMYVGEAEELPPCAFTRSDGYEFAGWATNSSGVAVYGDRASVYDLSDELNATVALYATWEQRFVNVETGNRTVAVPVAWLDETGIDLTAGYQTAAEQSAANGRPVWECYVAGTDPTNAASKFTAAISISNGMPLVTWSPNLNTNGIARNYTVLGKTNLTDTADWAPTNSAHRFFKVTVEMP